MRLFGRHKNEVVTPSGNIGIESVKEYRPQFERNYKVQLTPEVSIKVNAFTPHYGDRIYRGTLDQKDGRWVLFDVRKVADNILDSTLVPMVERSVRDILIVDKAFMDGNPNQYMDKKGSVWTRN